LRITSPFGWRINPISGRREFHQGVDIAAPLGTQIRSTAKGRVIFSGPRDGYGKIVVIHHISGYQTLYAHLSRVFVSRGDFVKEGKVIGLAGTTGRSTGPHLHYELRKNGKPKNPLPYILNSM
jgi:murein DD-endopeptidase MepM/ murein hydrolase activator NlpD